MTRPFAVHTAEIVRWLYIEAHWLALRVGIERGSVDELRLEHWLFVCKGCRVLRKLSAWSFLAWPPWRWRLPGECETGLDPLEWQLVTGRVANVTEEGFDIEAQWVPPPCFGR